MDLKMPGLDGVAATRAILAELPETAILARGWSNRRISQECLIAEITVRTHVSHIFGKLGVRNRVEAALHALRSEKPGPPAP